MEVTINELKKFMYILDQTILQNITYDVDITQYNIKCNMQYTTSVADMAATSDTHTIMLSDLAIAETMDLIYMLQNACSQKHMDQVIADHSYTTATITNKSFMSRGRSKFSIVSNDTTLLSTQEIYIEDLIKQVLNYILPDNVCNVRFVYPNKSNSDPLNMSPAIIGSVIIDDVKYTPILLCENNRFPKFIELVKTISNESTEMKLEAETRLKEAIQSRTVLVTR